MLVDCDTCVVRGAACGGCLVSVVLGAPPAGVELDADERRALAVLADAGMVPQLRLVTDGDPADDDGHTAGGEPSDRPPGSRPSVRRIA